MPASLSFLYTMPLPMNQLKIKNKYGNHGIKHYIKYFIFYSSPHPIFLKWSSQLNVNPPYKILIAVAPSSA